MVLVILLCILLVAAFVIVLRRIRKKKRAKELEIEQKEKEEMLRAERLVDALNRDPVQRVRKNMSGSFSFNNDDSKCAISQSERSRVSRLETPGFKHDALDLPAWPL